MVYLIWAGVVVAMYPLCARVSGGARVPPLAAGAAVA
jgi:hypothetical protein